MGVLFFLLFIFMFLCFGISFLIVGLIFLFLHCRTKKKGTPKKRYMILSSVFLILGVFICSLPVGYWMFLRAANSSVTKDYVDTGKMVEGGYQKGAFTVDGVSYEPLEFIANGACIKENAVFSWDDSSALGCFFGSYDRGNYYSVENSLGLDIVRVDSSNHKLWCRSDQLSQAQAWYGNDANYQWYLYNYDDDGKEQCTLLSPQPGREQIADLLAFENEEQTETEFTISKGVDIQKYDLRQISTDQVVSGAWISFAVYEGRLCLSGEFRPLNTDGTRTNTAYPLPADLDVYFSQLLDS